MICMGEAWAREGVALFLAGGPFVPPGCKCDMRDTPPRPLQVYRHYDNGGDQTDIKIGKSTMGCRHGSTLTRKGGGTCPFDFTYSSRRTHLMEEKILSVVSGANWICLVSKDPCWPPLQGSSVSNIPYPFFSIAY